jgi:hypothetical protein
MLPLPLSLLTISILLAIMSCMWLAMVPSIYISLQSAQTLVDVRLNTWDRLIVASHTCWIGGAYKDPFGQQGETYQLCHTLWWALSVGLAIAPGFAFVTASLYMWLMVPLKWLMVPKMSQKKMQNGKFANGMRVHAESFWLVSGVMYQLFRMWMMVPKMTQKKMQHGEWRFDCVMLCYLLMCSTVEC